MQKALLSTCILLALFSPVISLTCSYCRRNETSCTDGEPMVCNSTAVCTSGVLDNNIVPEYKMTTYRGCTNPKGCHSGDYSISSANGKYLQMKIGCCAVDKCNQEPRCVKPRKDFTPNGLECPACFGLTNSKTVSKCENQGTVSCLANETKCIELTTGVLSVNFMKYMKLKGCATEDVCALNGKINTLGAFVLMNIATQCSDAKKSSKKIDSK